MFRIKYLILLPLSLCLVLNSCGFKPLYANKQRSAKKMCDNFSVNKVETTGTAGQKLKYKLQDALNAACIKPENKYNIVIELTKTKEALGIQKDREITRYNLNLSGSYKVTDENGKNLYNGTSIMVGGFDTVTSDYGTYALEIDTEEKLLEEMANDIALKVSAKLLRN